MTETSGFRTEPELSGTTHLLAKLSPGLFDAVAAHVLNVTVPAAILVEVNAQTFRPSFILQVLVGDPPAPLQEHFVARIAYLPPGCFEAVDEMLPNNLAIQEFFHLLARPVLALMRVGMLPAVDGELEIARYRSPESVGPEPRYGK